MYTLSTFKRNTRRILLWIFTFLYSNITSNFIFFCNKYSYEVIFISDKKIFFYQTYSLNTLNTPNLSFFLSNLKNIYSKSYGGSIYFRIYDIRKLVVNIKNHPNLRVHFIFKNEKLDYCAWGYEIPMEEAEKVEKKIKEFLKKHNDIELK